MEVIEEAVVVKTSDLEDIVDPKAQVEVATEVMTEDLVLEMKAIKAIENQKEVEITVMMKTDGTKIQAIAEEHLTEIKIDSKKKNIE